ncbi:MAG TPA: thymidylate synthase [Candidatus Saccharimonadales bacterium]|nr:thymidylate synthase [Candidatus Saccharimonadales bacterium]
MPDYLPYEDRLPDSQYRNLLERIMREGEDAEQTRQGVPARTLFDLHMRFDLRNGFPVIPDRSLGPKKSWNKGIGELCGFMNGAQTVDELADFGADWWHAWTDPDKCALFGFEPGVIGPASYGPAMTAFPTLDGSLFDQIENIVDQIIRLPHDRIHRIAIWMPKENSRLVHGYQKTTIAPCHGDVFIHILKGRIHLGMRQRSCDTPVGGPHNMAQYAALVLMLEHLTGFEAGVFYHSIWNAHIYADQFDNVEELLVREPRRLPTVRLGDAGLKATCLKDFRREHFELSDYDPHPAMNDIPVST